MNRCIGKSQSGYMLLLFVLFFMGIGGVVTAGFTQGVKKAAEHERFLHNQRVLKAAKQALLMYAYRYPEIALAFNGTIRGPGRLPCPDTDAPGGAGTPNPIANCIAGGNAIVGRFPWNANGMQFYDVRDASNERLWYAVSQNFANPDLDIINSDTPGTITIQDQTGSVIYDGFAAGVAAVIIAPGPEIERAGVAQLRQTGAQQVDPTNYLDLFGALDNSDFTNLNAVDGFVLGPVDNLATGTIIVNDQVILVTVEEVIAMAEQATLQAYQEAVNDYNVNIGIDAYPWLDDYATLPTPPQVFDADVGTRLGRVPSIFANYFDNDPSGQPSQPIDSDLLVRINLSVNGFAVPPIPPIPADVFNANASIVFNNVLNGDLTITPTVPGVTAYRYYWDEEFAPDGWQECLPLVTLDERDCRQVDLGGGICSGIPDGTLGANQCATQVVRITYTNTLAAGVPFTRSYVDNAGLIPTYDDPTVGDHAYIFFEYAELLADSIDVIYRHDTHYLNSLDPLPLPDGDVNYSLGVRYYPELPAWALDPALTPSGNDWHDSVQMAYAAGFQPGAVAACTPGAAPPLNCLRVNNAGGIANDKIAVLTIASDHGLLDDDDNAVPIPFAPGFTDELDDIFDPENDDADDTFNAWGPTNNDKVLVIR
jgi:hypothetical protein